MIALLFPGQGQQYAGMLHDLAGSRRGAATIAEAGERLGRDLLRDDDGRLVSSTAAAQCALLIAGVACTRALSDNGVAADAVAGHSAGAFAAAVACGALTFGDALGAVAVRGAAMERFNDPRFAMTALSGLDETAVDRLAAAAARPHEPVQIATVNAADQIVVAGARAALARLEPAAAALGARVQPLPVQIPAHTPLLAAVERDVAAAFAAVAVQPADIPYLTGGGRAVRDAAAIRDDLIGSITRPVRWADSAQALYERGTRLFLEAPPGTVLTDLAARAFPQARAVALATTSSEAVAMLARRYRAHSK